MKICVVGAGVVGCSTAYQLQKLGHEVTLVDGAAAPGLGTSFANGGQLSYSYVEPLANPSTFWSLPSLLLKPDSPVRFRFRRDPRQWLWGLKFLAACRGSQARAGARQLLELGAISRATLEQWLNEEPLSFGFRRNGKLVICPTHDVLQRQASLVVSQTRAGIAQTVLSRDECIAREPRLSRYAGFVGGVWTPSECAADPHLYCVALCEAAKRRGMRTIFGRKVRAFAISKGVARALVTEQGDVEADAFVLCAGMSSGSLAAGLGEWLTIYPVKGYSLTLAYSEGQTRPAASVTDLSRKMVLAPLGDTLRVAAMAELVGEDLRIPQERLDWMQRAVESVYPGLCDFSAVNAWAGLRPSTPDSLPIIRPSRVPNVILNVGHGALGFTLAAGSAKLVARLLVSPH